ncbi:cytochrome-c peroxidase [Pedobacter sp. GR22-6]|uniref:cytochrome-c peroxidase n=1 Tax=Pedobacter sp. GR22-6 TaxID=3127957 RepID=UPI00307D2ADD
MKKARSVYIIFLTLSLVIVSAFTIYDEDQLIKITIPSNFPLPVYDLEKNKITRKGVELGRQLFYDGVLSIDGSTSCGSCHQQVSAFIQQDHDFSHGVENRIGRRNALPLMNLIFSNSFFWDGGVSDLDLSPLNAIENEVEMGEKLGHVLKKLNASRGYRDRFKETYNADSISTHLFLKSISQFLATMVSANSRYDRYKRKEGVQLNANELEGLKVFKDKCSTCHATDLFTDGTFRNNGSTDDFRFDKGRQEITLKDSDIGKFKVPSLRNVELTAPYMHDGSISTLEAVLEHYNSGIKPSETLDSVLRKRSKPGLSINTEEKKVLISFLKTLTDHEFIKDKRFSEF